MSGRGSFGLRDYVRYLRDSRTEIVIVVSAALVVLTVAEPAVMALLDALAPRLHTWAFGFDPAIRRWAIGLPPALAMLAVRVWRDWRQLRRESS